MQRPLGARIEELAALQPTNGALPALRAAQAQLQAAGTAPAAAPAATVAAAAVAAATPAVAATLPPPPAPIQAALAPDHRAVASEVSQGQAALRAGRIGGAGSDTALAHFQAALMLDPDNAQARAGLGKIAQALTVQASAATTPATAHRQPGCSPRPRCWRRARPIWRPLARIWPTALIRLRQRPTAQVTTALRRGGAGADAAAKRGHRPSGASRTQPPRNAATS